MGDNPSDTVTNGGFHTPYGETMCSIGAVKVRGIAVIQNS